MLYMSLSSSYALSRDSFQNPIGSVARYTHSSDFEVDLLNSIQYDGN